MWFIFVLSIVLDIVGIYHCFKMYKLKRLIKRKRAELAGLSSEVFGEDNE